MNDIAQRRKDRNKKRGRPFAEILALTDRLMQLKEKLSEHELDALLKEEPVTFMNQLQDDPYFSEDEEENLQVALFPVEQYLK